MFRYRIDDDLELRLLEERHAEAVFALVDRNREYLIEWMIWVSDMKSVEDIENFRKRSLEGFAKGESLGTGIWYQGQLAGIIGLNKINIANRSSDIGYWITAEMQGKGIVTRSCRAIINYAFNECGLNRIEIHVAVENTRSRAIPERLGFEQEGIMRQAAWHGDHFKDMALYSMLANDWGKLSA